MEATTIGLAGRYRFPARDPICKTMRGFIGGRDDLYKKVIALLRKSDASEFDDEPVVATHLIAELGVRLYSVRLVVAQDLLSRLNEFAVLGEVVSRMPKWALTMADDADRYGIETVIQAVTSRSLTKPRVRGEQTMRYPGSSKALIEFRKTIEELAELTRIRVELPNLTKLDAQWERALRRARYWVRAFPPNAVILGDVGMLVRYQGRAGLHPFDLERISGVVAVFLPFSSRQVLVAAIKRSFDPTATPIDQINRATARWSEDFFVASENSERNRRLRSILAEGWEGMAERELG